MGFLAYNYSMKSSFANIPTTGITKKNNRLLDKIAIHQESKNETFKNISLLLLYDTNI